MRANVFAICVLGAKRSDDAKVRVGWKEGCSTDKNGDERIAHIKVMADEEAAKDFCS